MTNIEPMPHLSSETHSLQLKVAIGIPTMLKKRLYDDREDILTN
jgi:hypothetical protein